jgi:hypothetical protein
MKRTASYCLLLSAALVLLAACSQESVTPPEGRFFFTVKEAYQGGKEGVEPSLFLLTETEKIYGCCNCSIAASYRRLGALLAVDILGIRLPVICLDALGPAHRGDFLELEEGVYSLEFSHASQKSAYELEVTRDALTVSLASSPLTEFAVPKFSVWWRYPRNSFVYLCGTTEATAWIYEDFLQRLRATVELEEIEFPASGELGYPRAPQGHHVDHPARYFIYANDDVFRAAGEALRAYIRDVIGHPSGVGISLRNWKNESYLSWMMDGTSE